MSEYLKKKKKDHTSPFCGRNWEIDGDSIEHIAKPEDILSHCPYLLVSECCDFPIPHCPLLWYVCVCFLFLSHFQKARIDWQQIMNSVLDTQSLQCKQIISTEITSEKMEIRRQIRTKI
ncbi:unnamed protein product [Rangifer tarandus platyrhynchus]|uniref:Uncharacterized protein n=1 Tax=Rangifer tarandus platyrhynchus TaxID=3082113 RepID=A0AC59Y5R2_RANTA